MFEQVSALHSLVRASASGPCLYLRVVCPVVGLAARPGFEHSYFMNFNASPHHPFPPQFLLAPTRLAAHFTTHGARPPSGKNQKMFEKRSAFADRLAVRETGPLCNFPLVGPRIQDRNMVRKCEPSFCKAASEKRPNSAKIACATNTIFSCCALGSRTARACKKASPSAPQARLCAYSTLQHAAKTLVRSLH